MRWSRWAIVAAIIAGVLIVIKVQVIDNDVGPRNRPSSINNLKQVMLGMDNHETSFGAFPARAIFDKQGKPLLNWRVKVLPFIDYGRLYEEFHLDEPWDSEHNQKLIADIRDYRNPSSTAPPNTTTYLGVCGKGLMFEGTEGRKMSDIRDGPANTIMVVEANDERAVPWTKPEDWEYDADDPLAGLGNAHPGGFNAAMADGSVRFLSRNIDPKAFHAMLTIAGGEPVNPDDK